MACSCGFGDGTAPQDPYHVAFECMQARPFWEEAVAAMDVCVSKSKAGETSGGVGVVLLAAEFEVQVGPGGY